LPKTFSEKGRKGLSNEPLFCGGQKGCEKTDTVPIVVNKREKGENA
jgi:hypothetical protein